MRLLISVLAAMAATGCTKEQMLAVANAVEPDNSRPASREERLRQREMRLSKKEARLGNGAAK